MTSVHPPKPQTTRALLISEGYPIPRVTTHFYKKTELRSMPGQGDVWAHIFECFRTGVERVWGTERVAGDSDVPDIEMEHN